MKVQITFTIATFFFELFFIRLWLQCKELRELFYFSFSNIRLIIDDHIHTDGGMSIWLVRIIHNKVSVTLLEFLRHYMHYWDIKFLVALLSPIGLFALVAGLWYLVGKKMRLSVKLFILLLLALIPLIEMMFRPQIPFAIRITLLSTPYVLLSGFGMWNFIKTLTPTRLALILTLLFLSIWWFVVFQDELYLLCTGL